MSATATVRQTEDGWYIVISDAENCVVRIAGDRATVALTPDNDLEALQVELEKEA